MHNCCDHGIKAKLVSTSQFVSCEEAHYCIIGVFSHRTLEGHPKPLSRSKIGTTKGPEKQEEDKDAEEENPFASIISDGEGSAGEEGEEDEE